VVGKIIEWLDNMHGITMKIKKKLILETLLKSVKIKIWLKSDIKISGTLHVGRSLFYCSWQHKFCIKFPLDCWWRAVRRAEKVRTLQNVINLTTVLKRMHCYISIAVHSVCILLIGGQQYKGNTLWHFHCTSGYANLLQCYIMYIACVILCAPALVSCGATQPSSQWWPAG